LVGDPRDRKAYAIAIAMLGVAFVVAVAGMCWVVAEHECLCEIPDEIWFVPAAIGGVFVGILIPFSTRKRRDSTSPDPSFESATEAILGASLLAIVAVAAGTVGATVDHLLALCVLGTALGGVFFGLFIPSPARRDS